ncbi:ImuA family protein [Sphingomonas sp.]|uniref:ImuA family protein n=1 Tax=Sphingomonas sp. TaxID=28214 RepID=UPI003AFFE611
MLSAPPPIPLAELKAIVAAADVGAPSAVLPFGVAAVDDRLAARGLALGGLHDVAAASPALGDDAAATLFLGGIVARCALAASAPVLWALTRFDLYAPGLEQVGLPASSVLYAEARDDAALLAVVEDAVRDGTPAAVVGEVRAASMVATRRLQLVAGEAGVPVLLLRRWRRAGVDPLSAPSAAATRWRVGCLPSARLPVAGVGRARWRVDLVRQRGGEAHSWNLEGCDAHGRLAVPAPSRDRAGATAGTAHAQAA